MGQHKYNPTAQAAKRGELPPKPKTVPKRQKEREARKAARMALRATLMKRYFGDDRGFAEAENNSEKENESC